MADIVERLRLYAQQFEDQHALGNLVLHLRVGADEIERKKAEIASLLNLLADARSENMKLRAALEPLACTCEGEAICIGNCMHRNARAALEGK